MSRAYMIDIEVTDFETRKAMEIMEAIGMDSDRFHSYSNPKMISVSCVTDLCGGQSEMEHFEELVTDIKKASKCKVKARYTCVENVPFEIYESEEIWEDDSL